MGFDDIYISKYLNPKLTAVRQDAYEMGRQAAGMLIGYIAVSYTHLDVYKSQMMDSTDREPEHFYCLHLPN